MRKSTTDEQSPAFQFYASDWISDPNRMKLSLEEQGAYILLYCHCWRSFRIPKDMEVLSRMSNCRVDKLEKIWKKISHLFEEKKDKEGNIFLVCIQADEERKELAKNSKQRTIAGKFGAKKRWNDETLREDA